MRYTKRPRTQECPFSPCTEEAQKPGSGGTQPRNQFGQLTREFSSLPTRSPWENRSPGGRETFSASAVLMA